MYDDLTFDRQILHSLGTFTVTFSPISAAVSEGFLFHLFTFGVIDIFPSVRVPFLSILYEYSYNLTFQY